MNARPSSAERWKPRSGVSGKQLRLAMLEGARVLEAIAPAYDESVAEGGPEAGWWRRRASEVRRYARKLRAASRNISNPER